ncbi:heterokaryon incompatibility protein-domain-containing protein [Paraphoma chrysanthemicola]|uniref:Heterokaryon incompatibility protein-domain-containing protein n=1 Tax=Paraphoma chrysanthemicola TaxID=798071 RepID=A0A8K0W1L9_9PLEO|nr:heterokaryon incompatibility protein-domain-containing protein [Paraphoma chrysanthemicola]
MMVVRNKRHTGMLPVLERLHTAKKLHLEVPRQQQSHVVPNRLCESCTLFITRIQSLILHFREVPLRQRVSRQPHYSSEDELTRGVGIGCHLCSKFMGVLYSLEDKFLVPNEIEEEYEDGIYTEFEERYVTSKILKPGIGYDAGSDEKVDEDNVYSVTIGKISKVSRRLDGFTKPLAVDLSDTLREPAEEAQTSSFTGSEACLNAVRQWHQICTTQHILCKPEPSLRRPTRLLDLEFDDTNDVRLIEGNLNDAPYATLSYSWGTVEQTMLIPSLYEQFRSRIPLNSLSNVVQDSIKVCRGLSIRYLWIDALCIVQGEDGDFAEEAARMIDIYGGSTINITAAATINTTQHFLVFRDALEIMDCVLKPGIDGGHRGYIRNRWLCSGARESNRRPGDYHVDSRAWTMQERFLSPRSIYFGPTGMHWECRKGIACEFDVDIDAQRLHKRPAWHEDAKLNLKLEHNKVSLLGDCQPDMDRVIAMRHVWNRVLRCYTGMELTNHTDKLVALSGVTSLLEKSTGLRASFGLWDRFFMQDLLWQVDMNTAHHAKVLDQAPSWSWANLGDCSIHPSNAQLPSERRGNTLCIQSSTATLMAPPPDFEFRRLPSYNAAAGRLVIRGKLVPCGLEIDDRGDLHYYGLHPRAETTPSAIDTFATPTEELSAAELELKGVFRLDSQTWPTTNNFEPDTLSSVQQPDVFCLLVVSELDHRSEKGVAGQHIFRNSGLVLTPVQGVQHHYRRLGVFTETYNNVDVEEDHDGDSRFRIPAEATYLWKNAGEDQVVTIV